MKFSPNRIEKYIYKGDSLKRCPPSVIKKEPLTMHRPMWEKGGTTYALHRSI